MRKLPAAVFLILALSVAIAACNGDDDADDANGAANGDTISMDMGEFYFDPDGISGEAGTELTIELENTGSQVHNFTIEEGDARGEGFDAWPDSEVQLELDAEDTGSLTLTLPDEPGEYEFICTIPGHYDSGQWGTLTVN
ncbi:MAG: hypothetical protein EA415_13530 [Sphaerobacteraceae bacterium]|nr:MAG: hypothetical protein EA415_13530 [Sphaerobacteraceae bacterium]